MDFGSGEELDIAVGGFSQGQKGVPVPSAGRLFRPLTLLRL